MKASILAVVSWLAVAQAQSQCLSVALAIPPCATSCLQSAASKVGCGPLDFACQCGASSSAAINSAAIGCVLSTCGPQTGLSVQTSAAAVCACASSAGPASSSAVASSTAAPSTAASSMAATSPATSGGAASAGTSASMASSTAAAAGASGASSATPAGSSATSKSGASFPGAGLDVIVAIGAGLAVFLGAVATL